MDDEEKKLLTIISRVCLHKNHIKLQLEQYDPSPSLLEVNAEVALRTECQKKKASKDEDKEDKK